MATFSKLIKGKIKNNGKYTARTEKVSGMIYHHAATRSFEAVKRMMEADYNVYQLSANYLIDNNGDIWGCVPEEYRAFTSADPYWDSKSITFECINEKGAPAWSISAAAQEAIAKLTADCARRYGFTPKRGKSGNIFGHRELYQYFGASYPTACPGGMPIDSIVKRANVILGEHTVPSSKKEIKMKSYTPKDTNTKNRPQAIAANGKYTNVVISDVKANGSRDVSIATKKPGSFFASVYLKGKPGQTAELAFTVATIKDGKTVSEKRVHTVDVPAIPAGDTLVKGEIAYAIPLQTDERLRVQVRVDGKEPLTVSRVGWSSAQ